MKKLLFFICFIAFSVSGFAQQTYTVNNETLELKTEVEGNLDLLWNIFDGKYRYFVRDKDGDIQELVNTKNEDTHKYQEEYKTVLSGLTKDYDLPAEKVNLTLFSLKEYFNTYNATSDLNFSYEDRAKLQSRLGVFGGITNQPFVENPNNKSVPFFGVEFEIFEQSKLPRHALFFQLRHALEHDDFKYSATQLAIGYRFRVINKDAFNFYGNLKMATYTISKTTYTSIDPNIGTFSETNSGVQVPFVLGLGADIKVSTNSFITLAYHDIYALFIDNYDNFPIDFALGYKINL
jgi:hypothetical protein